MFKKFAALLLTVSMLCGLCTVSVSAGEGETKVGQVVYSTSGNDVTATVDVATTEGAALLLCSYGETDNLIEIKTNYVETGGTLTATVKNTCNKIVASVLDNDGNTVSPAAVYGVDSTDLSKIVVNGKELSDFSNDIDKYDVQATSLDVEAVPVDGTTKVEVNYNPDPLQAIVTVTSSRGHKREITISAYKNESDKYSLLGLSYKIGNDEYPINISDLQDGEEEITLPDNTMSVQLVPKAIGDTVVTLEDEVVSSLENDENNVDLGGYYDIGSRAYSQEHYAIGNIVPLKNETAKAYIKITSGKDSKTYTLTFKARQPRLTSFTLLGASTDSYKPSFVGGSGLNNDNGTLICNDRGWIISNISKNLVGASYFTVSGDNKRDSGQNQWWDHSGKSPMNGAYYSFTADTDGTVYAFSGNTFLNDEWTANGWKKEYTSVTNPTWPDGYNGITVPKFWNDYTSPSYYLSSVQYKDADRESRGLKPGAYGGDTANGTNQIALSCVCSKSFTAGETVTIYHSGRDDANSSQFVVAIKWKDGTVKYAPEADMGSGASESLSPELPSLKGEVEETPIIMDLKFDSTHDYTGETTWEDESPAGNDLTLGENAKWTEKGLEITNGQTGKLTYLPSAVNTLLKNGNFTFQFELGDYEVQSANDYILAPGKTTPAIYITSDGTKVYYKNKATGSGYPQIAIDDVMSGLNTVCVSGTNSTMDWYVGNLSKYTKSSISLASVTDTNYSLGYDNVSYPGKIVFKRITVYNKCLTSTEVNELFNPTPAAKTGKILIERKLSADEASVMVLGKNANDGSDYTVSDVMNAIKNGDAVELKKTLRYYGRKNVVNGKLNMDIPMTEENAELYNLSINGSQGQGKYIPASEIESVITDFITKNSENKLAEFEHFDYFCDATDYKNLTNKDNVAKFTKELLQGETLVITDATVEGKIKKAVILALLIEELNESNTSVNSDDVKEYCYLTDIIPLNKMDNIRNKEGIIDSLKGESFSTVSKFKKALNDAIFVNIISNETSKKLTVPDKQNFFETYASAANLNLSKYNVQGVDKQAFITKLANKNCQTIDVIQSEINKIEPEKKADSKVIIDGRNTAGVTGVGSIGTVIPGNSGAYMDDDSSMQSIDTSKFDTSKEFTDMGGYAWAKTAVKALQDKGIVSGYSNREFKPQNSVTRAEFVTMIVKAYAKNMTASDSKFTDVGVGEWYYDNIMIAYALNIVNGVSDKQFMPNQSISRQDIAVILCNLARKLGKEITASAEEFADGDKISDYAKESVSYLKAIGVLNGDENGAFNPKKSANRAESAQMIYSFMQAVGEGAIK